MSSFTVTPTQPRGVAPPISALMTRFLVQALSSHPLATSVTRLSIHVFATASVPMRTTRFAVQALAGPGTLKTNVTRLSIYAIASTPAGALRMTRFLTQALATAPIGRPAVTRLSIYVIGGAPPKKILRPKRIPAPAPDYGNVNWRDRIIVTTSWRTDITWSQVTASEDRRSLASRPTHTILGTLTGMRQRLSSRYVQSMQRRSMDEYPFPFFSERTKLDLVAPASSSVLVCDTRYRRIWRGQRVLVFQEGVSPDDQPEEEIHYGEIELLFDDRIVLTKPLPFGFPKGADVVPCIDAHISLNEKASAVTDWHQESKFEVFESLGPWTLPSLDNKPGRVFAIYNGAPVFPCRVIHWGVDVSLGFKRKGGRVFAGRDVFTTLHGEVPKAIYDFTVVQLQRSKVFDIFRFFDTVRGRFRHFYMVAPQTHSFILVNWIALNKIEIVRIGSLETFRSLVVGKYIAFVLKAGAGGPSLHQVTQVTEIFGFFPTWKLTLVEDVAFNANDLEYITLAHKVRMTSDELMEEWITDEACSMQFSMEELDDEADKEIINL